eukprot:272964-Pyramimonas_sp.AAC.1
MNFQSSGTGKPNVPTRSKARSILAACSVRPSPWRLWKEKRHSLAALRFSSPTRSPLRRSKRSITL